MGPSFRTPRSLPASTSAGGRIGFFNRRVRHLRARFKAGRRRSRSTALSRRSATRTKARPMASSTATRTGRSTTTTTRGLRRRHILGSPARLLHRHAPELVPPRVPRLRRGGLPGPALSTHLVRRDAWVVRRAGAHPHRQSDRAAIRRAASSSSASTRPNFVVPSSLPIATSVRSARSRRSGYSTPRTSSATPKSQASHSSRTASASVRSTIAPSTRTSSASPDRQVHVSRRLLDDEDGPMLELLKGFHGRRIVGAGQPQASARAGATGQRFERFLLRS